MRFHADENVSHAVIMGLRRRGIDVSNSQTAGLLGATDHQHIAFALGESRVLVSHDADMLRLARTGVPHAGIAYCHARKYGVGELVLKLLSLARHVPSQEIAGRIRFL